MKLLWRGEWMESPGYEVPEDGVLIQVAAAVPIVSVKNASGRQTRNPRRKVAVFLYTDGPRSTVRKARTKRDEPRFTGDFRISVVLGELIPSGDRVIALASRVPPGAQQLVIHRDLVLPVEETFSPEDLQGVAAQLAGEAETLSRLGRAELSLLRDGPPAELARSLKEAVRTGGTRPAASSAGEAEVITPPQGGRKAADTVLRLKATPDTGTMQATVLGAGDYTRTEIIPALRRARLSLYAVANREPQIAAMVGREHGFVLATTDSERAIAETPAPGLVVVATAHDSHSDLASAALKAGHRVFVEKPPAVTPADVHQLAGIMRSHPGSVEIGFNRRYHPLIRRARARLRRDRARPPSPARSRS